MQANPDTQVKAPVPDTVHPGPGQADGASPPSGPSMTEPSEPQPPAAVASAHTRQSDPRKCIAVIRTSEGVVQCAHGFVSSPALSASLEREIDRDTDLEPATPDPSGARTEHQRSGVMGDPATLDLDTEADRDRIEADERGRDGA